MFASSGLFRVAPCPKCFDCELLNCIFSHDIDQNGFSTEVEAYDPASAGTPITGHGIEGSVAGADKELKHDVRSTARQNGNSNQREGSGASIGTQPPLKKRRLDQDSSNKNENDATFSRSAKGPDLPGGTISSRSSSNAFDIQQSGNHVHLKTINSVHRPVSPPPTQRPKIQPPNLANDRATNVSLPGETLNPRMVIKAPESHKNRLALLKMVHQLMEGLNKRIGETAKDDITLLSSHELAKLALDEEEHMACSAKEGLYRSNITGVITSLKRMNLDQWRKLVLEKLPDRAPSAPSTQIANLNSASVFTGLSSIQEEMEILQLLRTPLEGLEEHGYVTTPPTAKGIEEARRGVESAAGFEICDRCGSRFQVFPGRNENGRLTSHGSCQYHWAKLRRLVRQKTDWTVGQEQSSYACCSQGLGSEGCTIAATHVFKVTDPKRLASILQFEKTPDIQAAKSNAPAAVAFDCEMGYTTLGLELIRVTATSWPRNKKLLDVLVRTQGEILDLNTRFSGVTPEAYISALSYNSDQTINVDNTSEGELEPEPLRKVKSPAAARDLIFELLTPETPLIGHAIDNDLNSCRMIHPFIVDTVLLYPHPRRLPVRYGLKMLADKYLNRGIQMGGEMGHDSKEDAIATGDLVKVKVKEKWQSLRKDGWKFEGGKLVAPGAGMD